MADQQSSTVADQQSVGGQQLSPDVDTGEIDEEWLQALRAVGEVNISEVVSLQRTLYNESSSAATMQASSLNTAASIQPQASVNQPTPVPVSAAGTASVASSSQPASGQSRPKVSVEPLKDTWLSLGAYEDVLNSDFDYWTVKKELRQSGMEMTKILRVHNRNMEEQFDRECEKVRKIRPTGFDLNMECLYHGTPNPVDQVCEEGLDARILSAGHFGKGVYFSDCPEMCRAYCEDPADKKEEHFVVRCKVILGDQKIYADGQFDPKLVREPVKQKENGKNIFFDSVKGKVGPYTQYVIYENRRAFVQYIVYYTTNRTIPIIPDVPKVETRAKSSSSRQLKSSHSTLAAMSSPVDAAEATSVQEDDVESEPSDDDGSDTGSGRASPYGAAGVADNRPQSAGQMTNNDDIVSKVSVTRNRTMRLNEFGPVGVSGSAPGDSPPTVTGTTAGNNGSNSAAVAGTQLPSAANLQMIQEAAITQLMQLKNTIPDSQFDQLLAAYENTYGSLFAQQSYASRSAAAHAQLQSTIGSQDTGQGPDIVDLTAVSGDDDDEVLDADVQCVLNQLITEFLQLAVDADRPTAKQFIISNNMEIDKAIGAYFDSL